MKLQIAEVPARLLGTGAVVTPVGHVLERFHFIDDLRFGAQLRSGLLPVDPYVFCGDLGQRRGLLRMRMREDKRNKGTRRDSPRPDFSPATSPDTSRSRRGATARSSPA